MATLGIGDIHGNIRALDDLLAKVGPEISGSDTVVFLGDYIDRGPDSKACIERILDFRRTSEAEVITLLGNHEQWLLRTYRDHTRHSWILGMEAFATIRSYSPQAAARLAEEIEKHGVRLTLDHRTLPYQLFFEVVLQSTSNSWKACDSSSEPQRPCAFTAASTRQVDGPKNKRLNA